MRQLALESVVRLQLLERMLLPLARVLAIELVMALKQLALERIRIPSAETIAVAAASMSKRFYWLAPGLAGIARGAARSVAAFAGARRYWPASVGGDLRLRQRLRESWKLLVERAASEPESSVRALLPLQIELALRLGAMV